MRKKQNISNKISHIKPADAAILIVVFLMVVILIVGMYIGTEKYKEDQVLLIQDSMDVLADNQKVQFEQYINNKISLLKGLVTYPEIYEMDAEQQEKFIRNRSKALGFHQLFIMGEDGTAFYVEENLVRNQKDEPFFYDVMENDVFITEPFYGEDATTLTVSVSIWDENKHKVGALCGSFELKEVQEMFQESRMFLDGKSYLINRDGYYVASIAMTQVYNKIPIYQENNSEWNLVKEAFERRADKKGTIIQYGVEYQANVTYLKEFDWVIVQCIETEEIFENLRYIDVWRYVSLAIVAIIIFCVARIAVYWHRINKKINIDSLTGCSSCVAMQNLAEQLNLMKQYRVAVIYLDLNNFKMINDEYGHDFGDNALQIFGDVLKDIFGKEGYVGRIGGDEFMVLLLDADEKEIANLCEAVNAKLKEKEKELALPYIISTSYGWAIREKESDKSMDEIIRCADEQMYRHKGSQR